MTIGNPDIRYPLLLPFCGVVAGILLHDAGAGLTVSIILFIISAVGLILHSLKRAGDTARLNILRCTILTTFTATGILTSSLHEAPEYDFENDIYPPYAEGRVINRTQGEREYITAEIFSFNNSNGTSSPTPGLKVLLISDATSLDPGTRFRFIHNLRPISPDGNPFLSDYIRTGIAYSQHIRNNDILITGKDITTASVSHSWRNRICTALDKSPLQNETSAFLQAVITGDSGALSPDTKASFAGAGLAHILALSGLHVGILAGIASILFFPFRTVMKGKLRWIMTIPLVWAFVVLTGWIPSAVRAGIMLTAVLIALTLERRNSPLNALLAAMIFILLLSPGELFSAGLQFSFCCVAALLVFTPAAGFINGSRHPLTRRTVNIIAGCLTASMATLGLTAYYFHQCALWSLPFNLIVIPLLPFYLTLGGIYTVWLFIGTPPSLLGKVLDKGLSIVNNMIEGAHGHFPLTADVKISGLTLFFFFIFLAASAFLIYNHNRASLTAFFLTLVLLPIIHIVFPAERPADGFSTGWRIDTDFIEVTLDGNSSRIPLSSSVGKTPTHVFSQKIEIADKNLPKEDPLEKIECDILFYCHGMNSTTEKLLRHYSPKQIVIMPSVYPAREEKILDETKAAGIPCHSVRRDGPYRYFAH